MHNPDDKCRVFVFHYIISAVWLAIMHPSAATWLSIMHPSVATSINQPNKHKTFVYQLYNVDERRRRWADVV